MKLEYLYADDSFRKILENNGLTGFNEILKDNIFIFYFEIKGENEESAKTLSSIDIVLCKVLDKNKYYKLNDEAGEYFNKILYPLCNKFERLLRQVLCVSSMSKQEAKALKKCRTFESLDLGEIYNYFFTDKKLNEKINGVLETRNLTHRDFTKFLLETEVTLWGKLFNNEQNDVPDNFIEVKDYRNAVMHAKNIDYYTFQRARTKLKLVNEKLEDILDKLLSGSLIIEDDSSQKLAEMIDEIYKMDLSDKEKGDLLAQKILASIKKEQNNG